MAERTPARRRIDALLTSELEAAELGSYRLLLAGFSQGTMMSLHVGLRRPEAVAGISGMLVAPERLQAEIRSRPPVLLIHGTGDDVVAIRSMSLAETARAGAGVGVETHVPGRRPRRRSRRIGRHGVRETRRGPKTRWRRASKRSGRN